MLDGIDCINNLNIDLHNHTRFSDGDLSPEELVDKCIREGKEIIAITDHDGIEGSVIALYYSLDKPIELIPGIEFNTSNELSREMHILGYNIDTGNEELLKTIEQTRIWRMERNEELYYALISEGYIITREQINSINNGIYTGKPNFAKALIENGYAESIDEVFGEIFNGNPEIKKILKKSHKTEHIIDVIHSAGGKAVMAHPMEQQRRLESNEEFYKRLKLIMKAVEEYGIDGIECYHPSATAAEAEMLRKYAEERGLYVTRGSDFHSEVRVRTYGRVHTEKQRG